MKCAHLYAATLGYGMCKEHLHAQAVLQECLMMVPM